MKRVKRIFALALMLVLLPAALPGANAAAKNEIVYVTLEQDGTVDEIYVVNRFDSDDEEDIVDYGEYYAIQNLTNASDLYQTLDTVQFTKPAGTFFYQGDPASKALPWTF